MMLEVVVRGPDFRRVNIAKRNHISACRDRVYNIYIYLSTYLYLYLYLPSYLSI